MLPVLFTDETGVYFLENIQKNQDAAGVCLNCWIKIIYSDPGLKFINDTRTQFGLPSDGYENLLYTRENIIFAIDDYPQILIKILAITDYATDDVALSSMVHAAWVLENATGK